MSTLLPCPPQPTESRDTTDLVIHRASPSDTCALIDMFEQMSPRARHMRFFTPMPIVRPSHIRPLCDVDQDLHRAWLLRSGGIHGPVIAEVRGAREQARPDRADIALAVRDDWAGKGLGVALVDWISTDLASAGVTTLRCDVHSENTRSRRLFARAGFTFRFEDGSFVGERSQQATEWSELQRLRGSNDHLWDVQPLR